MTIAVTLFALCLLAYAYAVATSAPIVRTAEISTDAWPTKTKPLRVALLSDIHVAGPDMPPERLAQIVAQVNAEQPDLVLIAGDLISEKRVATRIYGTRETVRPLGELDAPLGIVAVMGNHDYWADAEHFPRLLEQQGVTVLRNSAVAVGPINIAGIDDEFTNHDDVEKTALSLRHLRDAPTVVLTHSPDIVPEIPFATTVVMAGHTHCGQIVLPMFGAISYMSKYGSRFACGVTKEAEHTIIVGAGLGTSLLPLRIGAPPDFWIVTLRDKATQPN